MVAHGYHDTMASNRITQEIPSMVFNAVTQSVASAVLRRRVSPRRVWNEVLKRSSGAAHRAALHVALRSPLLAGVLAEHGAELRHLPYYRSECFPPVGPTAWLDQQDAAERIAARLQSNSVTAAQAEACAHFAEHGYVVLPRLLEPDDLDAAWTRYEADIRGAHTPLASPPRHDAGVEWARLLNTHHYSPAMAKLLRAPALTAWLELLLGHAVAPVQSIASRFGREPPVHTDAVHVSSFPLGQVVAAAIAFEDGAPDSGPLQIYPGTHRLPYIMSQQVGITPVEGHAHWLRAYTDKYEPFMQAQLAQQAPAARTYVPHKGDVLLYHQNLWHAGSTAQAWKKTRRSMVAHYISRGAVAYQDISGRLLGIY